MTWAKLDDRVADHLKIRRAGTDAAVLYLAAITWSARHTTDGKVPKDLLGDVWRPLAESFDATKAARRLVDVGLWHDRGDHFEIHDFLEYNPSKADLEAKREKEREKKRRQRAKGSPPGTTQGTPRTCPQGTTSGTERGTTQPCPPGTALGTALGTTRGTPPGTVPGDSSVLSPAVVSPGESRHPDPTRPVPSRPDPTQLLATLAADARGQARAFRIFDDAVRALGLGIDGGDFTPRRGIEVGKLARKYPDLVWAAEIAAWASCLEPGFVPQHPWGHFKDRCGSWQAIAAGRRSKPGPAPVSKPHEFEGIPSVEEQLKRFSGQELPAERVSL